MPGSRQDGEGAAAESQHGRRHVDVAVLLEPGSLAYRPVGVHLDDLVAGDEADRVEVVDVEVAEDPARGRDVLLRRRIGVVRRRTHREDAPDAPFATASRNAR